jgi:ABC-type dipeptide/oligopeptide/nickel transport system permease component
MVIGATYLTATVLADIAYTLLNPRVRFGSAE